VLPKKYTAQTAVLVDVRSPDPVAGGAPLQGLVAPSYMATQVDIIGGDRVAQRVVKMLKLDENPRTRERWMEATEGRGTLEGWLADSLQKRWTCGPRAKAM
jgi:succinoglycan biosynthesis transport protein ExoP